MKGIVTEQSDDLIEALKGHSLHHVIKKIFEYLTIQELQNATVTCNSWQESIFNAGLWKHMFTENVKSIPDWKKASQVIESLSCSGSSMEPHNTKSDAYFYRAYMEIHTSLPKIDINWRKNNCSLQTFCFGEGQENEFTSKHVFVSPKWVFVAERATKNSVQVWNRKTNLLELTLNPTSDVLLLDRRAPGVVSTLNTLMVAFPEDRLLLMWSHDTWQHLATAREYSRDPSKENDAYNAVAERDKYSILQPRMIVHEDFLLTCLTQSEEVHYFTLRKHNDSDFSFQYQWCLFLNGTDQKLIEFDLSSRFVLLLIGPDNWDPHTIRDRWTAFTIQLRSNTTFTLLRNVEWTRSSPINCFHHDAECLIAVGIGNSVRVWDADTGACLSMFRNSAVRVTSVQMVSDKFIVTCDENGCLRVWDQQSILELDTEADVGELRNCLLWESSIITRLAGGHIDLDDRLVVLADEFHIAVLLSNDRARCVLHIIDFLSRSDL